MAVGRGGFPGALLVAALALAPAGRATAETPTGEPGFLVPGDRAERVVDGRALDLVFTEGPAVACDGTVFFSDITWSHGPRGPKGGFRAGNVLRFDPKTGAVSVFRSPSGMANGLAIDGAAASWRPKAPTAAAVGSPAPISPPAGPRSRPVRSAIGP